MRPRFYPEPWHPFQQQVCRSLSVTEIIAGRLAFWYHTSNTGRSLLG
jgi:hypothetical protein